MKKEYLLLVLVMSLAACVPQRKFMDLQGNYEKSVKDFNDCKTKQTDLQTQLDTLTKNFNELQSTNEGLKADTAKIYRDYRRERNLNYELNTLYEKVVQQNKELLTNATSTSNRLSQDLNDKKLELDAKQKELNDKQKQNEELSNSLKEREKRVNELESIIAAKDSSMNALKKKINDALIGFDKGDLSVETKGGKIYVSISDKLLFKSGSTQVDPKGKDALKKVADVLSKNPDITVDVEGHTDNVPLNGTGVMKDNWDLSVLRATTIVKILVDGNVDPAKIIASGHGEYHPKESNSSSDGRAKNRRTEIILSPDLSQLYKVINGEGK